MPTTDEIWFETERRVVLFHRDTTMPDASQLGFVGDPNTVVNGNTPGETLLYNSPSGTKYLDKGSQPHVRWTKVEDGAAGLWVEDGAGGTGTTGEIIEAELFNLSTLDISNMYVQLIYQPKTADEIEFSIKNAPAQHYGDDFKQHATFLKRVTWEGLSLDGVLQAGDKLTITYTRV